MVFRHKSGAIVDIDVLRPAEWVERNQLGVGSEIAFGNSEIETTGGGRVTGIGPCPPIADGPGSVVTARYVTRQTADLVTATFADGTELTGTRQHPVWCVTRQDWVGLGELLPGEEVETRQGPLAVRTIEAVPGLQPVYNLEVHGEHVYEVTDVGVLVHNNTGADCLQFAELQKKLDTDGFLGDIETAEYLRLLEKRLPGALPEGFDPSKGFKSFEDFKKAFGAAGTDKAWHHIVEQSINSGKFAPELLHNPANLFALPHGEGTIHAKISGYYSSKIPGLTGDLTVREWLSKKSFKEQFQFGVDVIKQFGGSRYLPPHLQ